MTVQYPDITEYDHKPKTAEQLYALNIGGMTASVSIFLDWPGTSELAPGHTIELPPPNAITITIKARSHRHTILRGALNQPVFETQSVNWANANMLIFEDFDIDHNSDESDFSFNLIKHTRVYYTGVANANAKLVTFGGAGAPSKTGVLLDCGWAHQGAGVTTNYLCRIWAEGFKVINPTVNLIGDVDIAGCFEFLGTSCFLDNVVIHQWAGRDITVAVFYINGDECEVTVNTCYMNDSNGGAAPTAASMFLINGAHANSRFAVSGILHHVEEDETKIMADAFTSIRTRNLALNWYDSLAMPVSATLVFLYHATSYVAHTTPGAAYSEYASGNRKRVDLTNFTKAKIIGQSRAPTSGGAGPGTCIYNRTDGAVLAEHTWSGNGNEFYDAVPADISGITGVKELSIYNKTDAGDIRMYEVTLILYN